MFCSLVNSLVDRLSVLWNEEADEKETMKRRAGEKKKDRRAGEKPVRWRG